MRFSINFFQFLIREFFKTSGETLFQCHTVKELLWGYTPEFVAKLDAFFKAWHIPIHINFTFGIYSGVSVSQNSHLPFKFLH